MLPLADTFVMKRTLISQSSAERCIRPLDPLPLSRVVSTAPPLWSALTKLLRLPRPAVAFYNTPLNCILTPINAYLLSARDMSVRKNRRRPSPAMKSGKRCRGSAEALWAQLNIGRYRPAAARYGHGIQRVLPQPSPIMSFNSFAPNRWPFPVLSCW
jgi:hypothetical protein